MSGLLSSLRTRFLGRDECRVIVVGLDGSGKTTIVYRLKHGKLHDSEIIRELLLSLSTCAARRVLTRAALATVCAATIGFNCECVEYKKMIFSLWDLGGSADAKSFWRLYYAGTQAIIFVIDSSDKERMVTRACTRSIRPHVTMARCRPTVLRNARVVF